MATDRGRITIDLTPELRRELKAAAAQADKSMREFVTESLRRDLAGLQRVAPTPAAVNALQVQAIRQLTAPLQSQLTAIAERAARAARPSQQEAVDESIRRLQEQLGTLAGDAQTATALQTIVEQHRSILHEALEQVQRRYLEELTRAQEAELAAMQQHLDPFTRDWASDEDSVYDDVD